MSSTRLPAISTTAVTMHPVPMDGTDGKVANERAQVGVSVVELARAQRTRIQAHRPHGFQGAPLEVWQGPSVKGRTERQAALSRHGQHGGPCHDA